MPVLFAVDAGNEAIVNATIDTKGADLTNLEIEMQNVIGEIILTNGGGKLFVTPAQIYRVFAGLEERERVAPTSEAIVIEIVDKMLGLSSSIDFEQHLTKHKNIKRVEGADYKGGKLKGHLIEENLLAGGYLVPTGYVFYDLPMYFLYSHLVRQMIKIPKRLLNPTISDSKEGSSKVIRKTPKNNQYTQHTLNWL